jgi:hypothetical protein
MPRDRPQVPDALPLKASIYARHGAGCCLHVVIDDGNLGDSTIRYCLDGAEHDDCRALAVMMLQMTPTQRRKLYATSLHMQRSCASLPSRG